ncbi:MAG: SDR family NAD(P)-dependent oxidoreductase, partial [bacterium]|nr:SDR family NAD(P)-dependent oxidoreductase [bacterium]
VWGAIHGIRAFLPRMIAQDREAHVINTSSGNGGLTLVPTTPIYSASKSAVTTVTETLNQQLLMTGSKVKASVLFPGPSIVETNIFSAERNRPEDQRDKPWDGPSVTLEDIQNMAKQAGHDLVATQPEEVAEHFLEGLREDRFWILPASKDMEAKIRARADGILARENPKLSF